MSPEVHLTLTSLFLASTGAQEVTLCVRLCVCLSVIFVNSSLNLHAIFMQSVISHLTVS